MRQAVVDTSTLASFGSLVLAVSAHMPMEVLQTRFAAQSKVAPSELLNDVVRSHLPGLALQAMPVPPRQIPFNAGFIYFEISRLGPMWEHVAKNGGLSLHIAGEFPGLSLQLWGIRE
jgi:type VI secretion system protein ImpJ